MLPATEDVRLIEISLSGVLLEATRPIDIGSSGHLHLTLVGVPFNAEVRIVRVEPVPSGTDYRIGAMFVTLPAGIRDVIELHGKVPGGLPWKPVV